MALSDFPRGVRGVTAADLLDILELQRAKRVDWVVPLSKLRSEGGQVVLRDAIEARINDDGVFPGGDAVLDPTFAFDGQLAALAGVPVAYHRKMRDIVTADADPAMTRLLDANVNTWLDRLAAEDPARKVLIRAFADADGRGIARAVLSNGYGAIDNLELFGAAVQGVVAAGLDPSELRVSGDITDTAMYVRIVHPGVVVPATELTRGYSYRGRVPQGEHAGVCAGLVLRNSETGHGAATIAPRFLVKVCTNGLTITKDTQRKVHLGGRLDDGLVSWSDTTQRKQLELVTSMTTDAVQAFMTPAYMEATIAEIMEVAETPVAQAEQVVAEVARGRWAEQEAKAILAEFFRGGQETAGGLGAAVTAYAQEAGADRAYELESSYAEVVEAAAKAAAKVAAG